MSNRRDILLGAGALALAWGGWSWWSGRPARFAFSPVRNLPGFRQISRSEVTNGFAVFAGLDETDPAVLRRVGDLRANPCAALFYAGAPPGAVPVASFSDYNCPYCRVLTKEITAIAARNPDKIAVSWHELPLLGPTSVTAARAALAADAQGNYAEFHRRMMRNRFVPNPAFLRRLAVEIGLDGERLLRDMQSRTVTARINDALALSQIFGIPGTPALVVGRSLVIGKITPGDLRDLIDLEATEGPLPCG